jgi:DNA-binding response OmpR family regulator
MPLALLLSPDDQAVSAITSVLEEMSVTCERPLDGASAAQKLNSNRFDLVLVDCENLPAAKLIFDVCRNRKGAGRPVPVAVVDGRAGLPTAFRLGAELILTKPVAKDQARITIRTAISRVKREDSLQTEGASAVHENAAPIAASQESLTATSSQTALEATAHSVPEMQAFAATAAAGSSFTSFSDPVPAFSATAAAMDTSTDAPAIEMSAAVAEPETAPETNPAASTETASKLGVAQSAAHKKFYGGSSAATLDEAKSKSDLKETTDAKATAAAKPADEAKITADAKPATDASSVEPEISADQRETTASRTAQKTENQQVQNKSQKKTGHLITLLVLLVACGGFYAAWTYEPGFQTLAKDQINHLLVVLGMAPKPQPQSAPVPVKPATQTAKPSPGVPVPVIAPDAAPPLQPAATDPNAVPVATSSPSTTPAASPTSSTPTASTPASNLPTSTASPALKAGTVAVPSTAAPSISATPSQPTPVAAKSGVTRIELPPNAVEHPAANSGAKPVTKSPPPQR